MWFYPLVLLLVVLALAGAFLLGGVFTIALVPIAAIIVISAVLYALWGRAMQGSAGGSTDAAHTSHRPLPGTAQRPTGRAPSSPERLVDARRREQ